jgi:hypothetical protein
MTLAKPPGAPLDQVRFGHRDLHRRCEIHSIPAPLCDRKTGRQLMTGGEIACCSFYSNRTMGFSIPTGLLKVESRCQFTPCHETAPLATVLGSLCAADPPCPRPPTQASFQAGIAFTQKSRAAALGWQPTKVLMRQQAYDWGLKYSCN